MKVELPVDPDRLAKLWPEQHRGKRVGALLHSASVTGNYLPTLDVLTEMAKAGTIELTTLFGPQHGFDGTTQDNMIEWESYRHPRLNIPVHSLYGEHRQPTPEMLTNMDVLFVDLFDVGSRYYTFIWTLFLCMKACEAAGLTVMVADRPNPLSNVVEGDPQDTDCLSFVGLHPLPNRHGKTIGELATQFKAEKFPGCKLEILPLKHWDPSMYYDETGLPWIMPSPNMPTLDTALVYPGMCLLEATNLSEGRGTTRPFEFFGAPWIEGRHLCRILNKLGLEGVHFREVSFEPTFQKHHGEKCHGSQLHILDRNLFRPVETGVTILRTVRDLYDEFAWNDPPYEYEPHKLPIEILGGKPVEEIFN